jgi:hypothetical protein
MQALVNEVWGGSQGNPAPDGIVLIGRITPPFSALNLQRFIGSGDGNAISKKLGDLAFLGMSAEAMAACLELVGLVSLQATARKLC